MKNNLYWLKLAIKQARLSIKEGGFPAGAVIVKDGKILAKGISIGFKLHDPIAHAETSAIRKACHKLKTIDLTGATLFASLQPCLMCFSVANWANIHKIVFACRKTKQMVSSGYYEGESDISKVNIGNTKQIKLVFISDLENESLEVIKDWERKIKKLI